MLKYEYDKLNSKCMQLTDEYRQNLELVKIDNEKVTTPNILFTLKYTLKSSTLYINGATYQPTGKVVEDLQLENEYLRSSLRDAEVKVIVNSQYLLLMLYL